MSTEFVQRGVIKLARLSYEQVEVESVATAIPLLNDIIRT